MDFKNFAADLKSKCTTPGTTFSGEYWFEDYANTGRTLGKFLWNVKVELSVDVMKMSTRRRAVSV